MALDLKGLFGTSEPGVVELKSGFTVVDPNASTSIRDQISSVPEAPVGEIVFSKTVLDSFIAEANQSAGISEGEATSVESAPRISSGDAPQTFFIGGQQGSLGGAQVAAPAAADNGKSIFALVGIGLAIKFLG